MPPETLRPRAFADLPTSPAYPRWAKPEPADNPTKHRATYTFLRGLMATWDRLVSAAQSAAYCHGASTAPADALDYLGETYGGLARALVDTDASYRDYLANPGPFGRWSWFGTKRGLLRELAHLGYQNAQIVTWRDLVTAGAGAPGTVFGGYVNFFFVALFQPARIAQTQTRWNDGVSRWNDGQATWGEGGSAGQQAEELRRVIQMVKPAHTSCRFIVAFLDSTSGLNAQLLPTGKFTTFPMNEPWERARPTWAYHNFYIHDPLSAT
jgi:hypothetical protein